MDNIPNISEKKLKLYVDKLYRGELKRYKKKLAVVNNPFSVSSFFREENKIKRINPSKAQTEYVKDKFKDKCVVCGKDWDKDDFEIHHLDGNRSNTVTSNLVLMCHRCHKRITRDANAKLKDYINSIKDKPQSSIYNIKPIKINLPKPPKYKL